MLFLIILSKRARKLQILDVFWKKFVPKLHKVFEEAAVKKIKLNYSVSYLDKNGEVITHQIIRTGPRAFGVYRYFHARILERR